MSTLITAQAEKVINAPAATVYQALSDPQQHATFIDKPFYDFEVIQNVIGAGAVVAYKIDFGGGTIAFQMAVTEPEPGRKLVWTDTNASGLVTTYTLTPQNDKTLLKIASQWAGKTGVVGTLEKVISPIRMKSVYNQELARIAQAISKN